MCIWTEKQNLKALTLMTFDASNGKINILSLPIFASLQVANENNKQVTIGQVWYQEGRDGLKERLESALGIRINGFISFDQQVVAEASRLVGTFHVNDRNTTLLRAFEDTRTERRQDDQDVLRAMAATIISPGGLKKVPQLLWIFTKDVSTDIHPNVMLKLYRVISHQGPTILTKNALYGKDYYLDGCRYRYVEPTTWKNILNEISA
ncbi:LCP family protein [Desulfotomaculum sp. 1211_IL3151]|uniref:LCP family protein n=1 Tax=Desulfotomaculum sp. 1211_IL3151 TaxID=3084055 RepID=UPI002FD8B8E3